MLIQLTFATVMVVVTVLIHGAGIRRLRSACELNLRPAKKIITSP